MTSLQIRPLGYALGAEVTGIDLRQAALWDSATMAAIRRAWLEHLVLCFPKQDLTMVQLVAFAARFGEVDDAKHYSDGASVHADPENKAVIYLTNRPIAGKPWDGYKSGQTWHSDLSHSLSPALASLLYARELPEVGGDTLFANQYMAYEALSDRMKALVEGLSLVHDVRYRPGVKSRSAEQVEVNLRKHPPAVHPVVRLHPETGRKALYVGKRVPYFAGMTQEESKPLLNFLNDHATRYEFTYRHRWSVHDVVIWDNRCLLHMAPSDYDLQKDPRVLWRCSVRGPQIGHFYQPEDELAAASPSVLSAAPAG